MYKTMRCSSIIFLIFKSDIWTIFLIVLLFFSDDCNSKKNFIGLNVDGKMKCLMWSKASFPSTLTPLFSSSKVDDEGEDPLAIKHKYLLSPSAVFTTAEYAFRKERWYGLKKMGILFRWNILSSSRNDERIQPQANERGTLLLPTTLDISASHVVSPSSIVNNVPVCNNFLRLGWLKYNQSNSNSNDNLTPWIQIGFDPVYASRCKASVDTMKINDHSLYLNVFLPVFKRFDFQWVSRWNKGVSSTTKLYPASGQLNTKDDPWWIPKLSLDPSVGTLSSENSRYSNVYSRGNERQYRTEFKVRVRTRIPAFLLSSANNGITILDDEDNKYDDNTESASLRFDCSIITNPVEKNRDSSGPTMTTARLDMTVAPSRWWRSIVETARLGFIHEQNIVGLANLTT